MKKRILALLLTLALVLPAVSCDILLADPNAPVTPSDSQSASNNDTEKAPSKGPEVHTQPQTPPDSEPEDSEQIDPPVDPEPETEYIPKEFKVTFVLEGYDNEYGVQFVKEGNTVGKPKVSIDPAIGSFDGIWYTDPHFKQVFDFGTYLEEDITLYGRFVPNPAAPALLITPEQIAEQASEGSGYASSIASADVITNGKNSFVRLTASSIDPYFIVARDCGKMPDYLVIRYRTNSEIDGEMFIGSGAGPHGQGDHCDIEWNGDSEWHLAIIHLPTCGATSIKDGLINYLRMDFFTHFREGDYIDFAYIGFFNSPEYAQAYDFEHYPPYVELGDAGIIGHSIDTFFVNGQMYFPEDGQAGDKLTAIGNTISFGIDEAHDSMTLRGWIGFDQPIVSFGYYVDNYTMIYSPDFTKPTEDAVKAAGGAHASRYEITVPLADLERGTHTVGFVIKLADGTVVRLREEITVVIPTHYADYNVPQDQWVISGHRPQLQNSSDGMVAAAGVEYAALLHQGSIYLGEIDLSKYSKVVIYWGADNSQVTMDRYNTNAHNRIMLLSADMDMVNSPTEDTIIAGSTYTLHGWAVQAHEIDLTDVDYNGPVYVTWDTLPGTFMLISSVEFIGGEIVDEPETPAVENVVIDLSTIEGYRAGINYGYDGPILNIGYDQVYLVGEFDLNQYSQIIIEYSYDGDTKLEGKPVKQNWDECGRTPIIGFTALNKCFGFASVTNQDAIDNGIYTDLIYTPGSWAAATRTAIIEIPEGIGYSGPCYVSAYNPWHREIAIASITLVPRA